MARHVVYRLKRTSQLVVIAQSDWLDHLTTRVVVPLVPVDSANVPQSRLNPIVEVKAIKYLAMTQALAAVRVADIEPTGENLTNFHEKLVAATDMLFEGY
ncbi:MAG: CcdB family protein [Ahrensia sp.]|nr:CcdB family protein [Ahrensia sp.]